MAGYVLDDFFFTTLELMVVNRIQRPHIVETEPFGNTFGPKAQRKRPKLDIGSIEELGESSAAAAAETAAATAESRTYRFSCRILILLTFYSRGERYRRFGRHLSPHHFYRP